MTLEFKQELKQKVDDKIRGILRFGRNVIYSVIFFFLPLGFFANRNSDEMARSIISILGWEDEEVDWDAMCTILFFFEFVGLSGTLIGLVLVVRGSYFWGLVMLMIGFLRHLFVLGLKTYFSLFGDLLPD